MIHRLAKLLVASITLVLAAGTAALGQESSADPPGPIAWATTGALEGMPGGLAVGPAGGIVAVSGATGLSILSSPDGTTWTDSKVQGKKRTDALLDIMAVPDGFLATGIRTIPRGVKQSTLVWRSPDGVTWTGPEELSKVRFDVAFTDGESIGLAGLKQTKQGNELIVWQSSDGVEWTALPPSDPEQYFGPDVAAFGPDGSIVLASRAYAKKGYIRHVHVLDTDGTWQSARLPIPDGWDDSAPQSVVGTPEGWLMSVTLSRRKGKELGSAILASADGHEWQPVLETGSYIGSILASPSGLVALPGPYSDMATLGRYWTSDAGSDWTEWPHATLERGVSAAAVMPDGRLLTFGTTGDPSEGATIQVGGVSGEDDILVVDPAPTEGTP